MWNRVRIPGVRPRGRSVVVLPGMRGNGCGEAAFLVFHVTRLGIRPWGAVCPEARQPFRLSLTGRGRSPHERFGGFFGSPAPLAFDASSHQQEKPMSWEAILLVAGVIGWFVLNRWILPKLGVPT